MRTWLLLFVLCCAHATETWAPDAQQAFDAAGETGAQMTIELKAALPATRKGEAIGEAQITLDHMGVMTVKGLDKAGIAYSGPYELTATADTKGKPGARKQYIHYVLRNVKPAKPGPSIIDLTISFRFDVGAKRDQVTANGTVSVTKGDRSVIVNLEGKVDPVSVAKRTPVPAK